MSTKHLLIFPLQVGMLIWLSLFQVCGQEIKKEVFVVKPYKPSVSNVYKISRLPVVDDTLKVQPEFSYGIKTRPVSTDFKVTPIHAAKMVGEPLPKLYNTLLRLGLGSHYMPYAEMHMNTLRSKNQQFGIQIKHFSSQGKVKLKNGKHQFAGFADNDVHAYGQGIFNQSILTGKLDFTSDTRYFYGYTPLLDTTLDKNDIKQRYMKAGGSLGLYSTHTDSNHLNYNGDFSFSYLKDRYEFDEKAARFGLDLYKIDGNREIGLTTDIAFFNRQLDTISGNHTQIKLTPRYSKFSDEWKAILGLNTYAFSDNLHNEEETFSVFPKASLEFNVVKNYLVPYLGIDGKIELNSLDRVARENPFVKPGLNVKNTKHKMILYGGLKGKFSNAFSYNVNGEYALIDDMVFFVNDSSSVLENQFLAVYDDVERVKIGGELGFEYSHKLQFLLQATFYDYLMAGEDKPWHKPELEVTFSTRYNIQNKILFNADLYGIGKRYAKDLSNPDIPIELNAVVDFNIGLEYRYTKILSFFLNFNNLGAGRYDMWNQYPAQRFNLLAGFTYAM